MLKVTEISSSGMTISGLNNIVLREVNVGIPFYLGTSYFFTERIGINVGILDTVGVGVSYLGGGTGSDIIEPEPAFINVFSLKIGPIFKL